LSYVAATTYRLKVDSGETYLLRIINSIMNEEQFFGIAKHKLILVATDASYTKQITVDYLMISPGQTMDVLLTTNQSPSRYYIVSTPFADSTAPFDNTTTTAILQYNGNYKPPSSIPFPTLPTYNNKTAAENFTKRLRSLASKAHPVNVPRSITRSIFMTVSVNQIYCPNASCSGPDGNRLSASLNNISFQTPTIDVLQAYYRYILPCSI
jgi:laccase